MDIEMDSDLLLEFCDLCLEGSHRLGIFLQGCILRLELLSQGLLLAEVLLGFLVRLDLHRVTPLFPEAIDDLSRFERSLKSSTGSCSSGILQAFCKNAFNPRFFYNYPCRMEQVCPIPNPLQCLTGAWTSM